MSTLARKLSSRKLWAAIVGVITGIAMVFGLDQGAIGTVSGAVVAVASTVAFIYTEGKVDAASVSNSAQQVQDAIEAVKGAEGTS